MSYHDAIDRYRGDSAFRTLVDTMTDFGMKHPFTPGEFRDAAFCAALRLEMLITRGFSVAIEGK